MWANLFTNSNEFFFEFNLMKDFGTFYVIHEKLNTKIELGDLTLLEPVIISNFTYYLFSNMILFHILTMSFQKNLILHII